MLCRNFIKKLYIRPQIHSYYCTSEPTKMWPDRIFSGIQPTGTLHIGNYFGAVKNWVNLQDTCGNVMCCVADLHSMTLPHDIKPDKLPANILLMTACLLGCGINPERSVLFLQSQIPEHTQLNWLLACLTTSARLGRLPQYKEKCTNTKNALLGLFSYPVLQAADILIHQATKIPVGIDQIQHLQLAKHLAEKFNTVYGETFPFPKEIINDDIGDKIRSLRNPSTKMSKSCTDTRSRIEVTDTSDEIVLKIKKAVTDCTSRVTYDPDTRPGVSNLIAIHSLLSGRCVTDLCDEAKNLDTGMYKMVVAELLVETLRPIREEVNRLYKDKGFLVKLLDKGAMTASKTASKTWKLVQERVGLSLHAYK